MKYLKLIHSHSKTYMIIKYDELISYINELNTGESLTISPIDISDEDFNKLPICDSPFNL